MTHSFSHSDITLSHQAAPLSDHRDGRAPHSWVLTSKCITRAPGISCMALKSVSPFCPLSPTPDPFIQIFPPECPPDNRNLSSPVALKSDLSYLFPSRWIMSFKLETQVSSLFPPSPSLMSNHSSSPASSTYVYTHINICIYIHIKKK